MKKIPYLFVVALIFVLSTCKKNDSTPKSFDQVIQSGGDFQPAVQSEQVTDTTDTNEVMNGEVWNCTTKTYDAMAPGGGDNGFPLFNPNASVIYPGSLLQGKSLKQATPDVIAVKRAGGTVSYDLNNGNLSSSFTVDEVSKSAIQNAMNQIIANAPSDLPANFVFTYEQVQSEQSLALKLGIDYNSAFVDVSADFNLSKGSSLNHVLVKLSQSFYTMSFDIPTSTDELFAPSVTPSDLAKYVQEGNPATYISDVTYGRVYYMLIESTSSYQEMETDINASFNGVVNSADAEISGSSLSKLSNLKIKVMAFGGNASTTLLTVGETDLNKLVSLLAESTTISTGLPISYVVRSVLTNQIVSVQLATKYDVTNCVPAPAGGEPPYTVHWRGQVLKRMGPVGAAFARDGTKFVLISQDGKQFMRSDVGILDGPYPIADLAKGTPPFDAIGAACSIDGNVGPTTDSWVMIMDITGSQYSYIRGDTSWSTAANPISTLANGDNPFGLNGIGALIFNYHDPLGPSNRFMFNKDGTAFSLYSNNPNSFGTVINTEKWGNGKLPFEVKKVGAGMGFTIGNKTYYLLFNYTGTKYCIYGDVFGTGIHAFIGPFDL
jgi:thiol-activated cytolysin